MTAEDLKVVLGGRLAMITVVLPHQRGLIERNDMTVLPYPVNSADLLQAIEQAERSAAQAALSPAKPAVGKDTASERPAEEKLLILKAKEILMRQFQMTEVAGAPFFAEVEHGPRAQARRRGAHGAREFVSVVV